MTRLNGSISATETQERAYRKVLMGSLARRHDRKQESAKRENLFVMTERF